MNANSAPGLILASASPRRVDLLARLGVTPRLVDPADCDETPLRGERPVDYVQRIAASKAERVAARHQGAIILAADTVVALGRRILPKALDEATARSCLTLISGRRHRVHTAVTVIDMNTVAHHRLSTTTVTFKRLGQAEIDHYIDSSDWQGKAGGYAIQGRAEALIRQIAGSHSGVMGLPLFETRSLLLNAGIACG